MPQFFEGLQSVNEDSFQKILISLLDPENIETKTEIELPMPLAQLAILADVLEKEGVPDLPELLRNFIKKYLVYQVSHLRKGRTEIIGALTEGIKEERRLREKLTSPNTEV